MRIIFCSLFLILFITLVEYSFEGDVDTTDTDNDELFQAVKPFLVKSDKRTGNEHLNTAIPFLTCMHDLFVNLFTFF
jgi:hypothetical protein